MSITTFTLIKTSLFQSIEETRVAREAEAQKAADMIVKKNSVSYTEKQIELRSNAVIADAYATEKIDGKNSDQRKAQEGGILSEDPMLVSLYKELGTYQSAYAEAVRDSDIAKANRRYTEDVMNGWFALCRAFQFTIEEDISEEI